MEIFHIGRWAFLRAFIAMMTLIYRIILAGIVALIGWDLFTEEKLTLQLNAAMVLIPLVLRVLMIK